MIRRSRKPLALTTCRAIEYLEEYAMKSIQVPAQTFARGLSHTVHHVRRVSGSAFVLRVDRRDVEFEPGQYINVGLKGSIAMREYSVYSGGRDDFLEVLVKEVEGGLVSKQLARVSPGDPIALDGPFGFFTIDESERENGKFLFVASGTGISPFHCFVRSYPGIDYTVLHGVRTTSECYDHDAFAASRYLACVSRTDTGAGTPTVLQDAPARSYRGRVTAYLREHPADPASLCYLCGNCDMIYEAFDILRGQGVPANHLFAEVYF